MEVGRKVEQGMKKEYLEKEDKYQRMMVEVNILKGKLEEKDKHLRFQDSTNNLDNILNIKRYLTIQSILCFHETVKGEFNAQACTRILKDNIKKSKISVK